MIGYMSPSKSFNPVEELPSMAGKVIIVTGSSSGIGFASLQHLCRMGAKVYMATPDEDRTQEALKRVEREGREPGMGQVLWHELELSDPRSAKASAERFMARETKLDVLINNAALITDLGNPQLNADGIQDSMAINYLGPYVFTKTLLPLLETTASNGKDVRIVNDATRKKSPITLLIVHPGAIFSDGAIRSLKTLPFPRFWVFLMGLMMYPQTLGAHTSVFAACNTKDSPHIFHGAYICPPNVSKMQDRKALDENKQTELAEFTENLLEELGIQFD
ncbi:NAD(P)-binding protein [Mycena sanguinolenta]|uniref:NAD(P)-binding protein n=1 Tax=Mycena sanguinolenta TaxID=230812 RepID=A0A8H7D302_9AGAR|nr:NAD(P)-binding protein [Mycena sanguinolenta]